MSGVLHTGTSRRARRPALGAAGTALAIALLVAGCGTPQQVRWYSYQGNLQQLIDGAAASRDCATLQVYLLQARSTDDAHQRASGISNAALVRYIDQALARAGC